MHRAVLAAGVSLAVLVVAFEARAQGAVSGVEVVTTRAGALNLTAPADNGSRLGLTPLETPASVEVLSGDVIRARGDLSLSEAIARSTGIVQQNNPGNGGTGSFSVRGFSGVGSVMMLVDGMRMFVGAGTISFPFDPWTVERVEVLRGPASIMYGQGAIGGAVNVVPKRPDPRMRAYDAQAAIGSDRTYRLAAGVGGPANDTVSYRFDVSRNGSNGYVDRGDSESWALSGSLRWQPSETFNLVLSSDYGDQKPMRYFGVPLIGGRVDERTRDLNYNVFDSRIRYQDHFNQARAEWTPAEGVRVRNALYLLTSDREWRNVETYSYLPATRRVERTDYVPILHDQRQVGDVLDVSLEHDLGAVKNTLLVGTEYNRIRFQHTNDGFPGTTSEVDAFAPEPGLYLETAPFIPRYRTRTRQYAFFAEDQLKLTDRVSLVGGLRYDHYRIRRLNLVSGALQVDKELENTSWRIGAVYQPTPNLSLYAQYVTGADPIGSLITLSVGQAPFELAKGRQYEAGLKGVLLGGRAEWTLAAYKIVKEDLLTRDVANPTQQVQVGQQSSKGIEASVSVQLGAGVSLEANGTVLDAEYDDFLELVGGRAVSRAGNTPFDTPEESANLWLTWQATSQLRLYGGVRYVGRQWSDNANTAALRVPSYTVVDAGAEWRIQPNLALNLQLFNAFDELYAVDTYGPEQYILGRPRAFELRLTGRF